MRISYWCSDVCSSDLAEMFVKQLTDLFFALVNAWEDYVAGRLIVDLLNVLSKIRVDDANAPRFEQFIQVTFFREHGFAFHHLRNADRKSVVEGRCVAGSVDVGGRLITKNIKET